MFEFGFSETSKIRLKIRRPGRLLLPLSPAGDRDDSVVWLPLLVTYGPNAAKSVCG